MLVNEPFNGNRIYLKSVQTNGDISLIVSWLCDSQNSQFLESRFQTITVQSQTEYIDKISNSLSDLYLGIYLRANSRLVGTMGLQIDTYNRVGTVGILVGDRSVHSQGIGSDALTSLIHYSFNHLYLRKIYAGVIKDNLPSMRLFQKLGFQIEGVSRLHAKLSETNYQDVVRFALFSRD